MKTIEYYIRQDKEFRKTLLERCGGIMKFWAQHPDAEFDADLFTNYENQIVEAYLQANKRNRTVAALPENELKMEARTWNHHTEKEIHYKVALQPLLANLPMEVMDQANRYIDDYLADAYRDYRRCYYPKGITPLAFYDEVVKQFGTGGLARDCMDYVLREHHHPEVWAKKKSEYALMTEFFIQQYSEVIGKDAFKMLRQAVKEKLAGKNSKECRQEAIKTMNLVKGFSRMIYSSAEVGISDCTGRYIVDKEYLRELTGTNAALSLLSNAKVSPLHECFFNYVTLLNDIGRIWAARLLKYYGIDMHKLEKETGAILYPVTKPLQNPDGAVHGNYKYYVDKDFSDSLDDQCCIYDEKQAKELLDALRKEKKSENLASQLKDSIMQFVDNINKKPELVMDLGKIVAKTKFDWSFMKAVICGLSEKWLMDKAILVMVDTWNEHVSRKDEICYKIEGYTTMYEADEHGLYSRQVPMMKILKYTSLERDLKSVRDVELERREVDAKFNKMTTPTVEQIGEPQFESPTLEKKEEPQFTYTEETFKKSAMITDLQLDLVLAELIVNGWMPKTSLQSDFRKLFSGVTREFYLTWTGKNAELHDFFDMLTRKRIEKGKKLPGYVTPRGNYLNIVRSHFKDEKGNWFGELNHERHAPDTKDILNKLEIVLTYSIDECINMMQTIVKEHKELLEIIDLSVKPEHYSCYGRRTKSVK